MMSRRWLPVALAVAGVLLAGCAGQRDSSSVTATDNPAVAEAKAAEAKAKAEEAKSKAEEAAARAEKAKADAKRARSDAATAAKSSSGASGSSAAGSSHNSPSIWISCDPDNYTPNVTFSGDWRFSTSTARLFIDYGDGRHYTTSHIPYFRSAYRHTYNRYGTFPVSIGLLVGAVARTEEAATAMANLVVLPMAFLSGSFFAVSQMPRWLQTVSQAFPLRHLTEGMLDVLVRGRGPGALLVPTAVLAGFALLLTVVATRVFRWDDV
jgi:hypothetical protein